jgi:hypothetical protein
VYLHLILAFFLRFLQDTACPEDQVFKALHPVIEIGDAYTAGYGKLLPPGMDVQVIHSVTDPDGCLAGCIETCLCQKDDELIASIPTDNVDLTKGGRNRFPELDQNLVTH